MRRYSEAVKADVRRRMSPPMRQSVAQISAELGIENEWHAARDAQLGEDAHRYADRIGAPVFAFLRRTVVMNLLRRAGYRSIRQGLRELAYEIHGMLELGGVQLGENRT